MMKIFKNRFILGLKATLALMAYCLFITLFMWGGMYLVSFIPYIGQGPEGVFSIQKMMIFWVGTISGVLSLFVWADITGGKLSIKFQKSGETPT